jgi:Spy/CpxP family protein refolding chaperone
VPEQRVEKRPPYCLPEDLHLTPKQIEQIKSIQGRYLNDIGLLRNELRDRKFRLRKLLSDPTSEASDIRSEQKEIFALENQMQERILDYQLEVRQTLTPEQFRLWVSRQRMPFGPKRHHRHGTGMRRK